MGPHHMVLRCACNSVLQNHSWRNLGGQYGVVGIELGLATRKTSVLPAVLSLGLPVLLPTQFLGLLCATRGLCKAASGHEAHNLMCRGEGKVPLNLPPAGHLGDWEATQTNIHMLRSRGWGLPGTHVPWVSLGEGNGYEISCHVPCCPMSQL